MKKVCKVLIGVTMMAALFSGCDKQSDEKNPDIHKDNYKYEQQLNIINDNNRNYYEIFVSSFYDSNGDGTGDIKGIIEKLDYITDLGFNGIWLMPIMPSPTYHKYDVTDYYSIDPSYGNLDDFKQLTAECEKRDVKVLIDLVFNHTSDKHPWFLEASAYLQSLGKEEDPDPVKCPYVEYYHFSKEDKGGWHAVEGTDWYYEGVFWDQMPDLKLENKAVRKEIEEITDYWLGLGVGGFRLDAAKEYVSGSKDSNVEILSWYCDYVKSKDPDAYIVAEVWDSFLTIADYYESDIDSIFNYPLAQHDGSILKIVRNTGGSSQKSIAEIMEIMQQAYGEKNSDYIDAPFISCHDNSRVSAQYANDEDAMKLAAGILMTMNGSPFVYYGEEIGMNSQGDKDENKRLEMHWSDKDKKGTPNPPANADKVKQTFSAVDEQIKEPLSLYQYYKRAIRIRNENPEIARGKVAVIDTLDQDHISGVKKEWNNSEILIIYNTGTEEAQVNMEAAGIDGYGIRGYLTVDGSEVMLESSMLKMPSKSIVILKRIG